MDVFESLFKFLSRSNRQKERENGSTVQFKNISKYLHIFSQYEYQGILNQHLQPSLNNCGFINGELYFPDQIGHFDNYEDNLKLYTHLALINSKIKKLNLKSSLKSRSQVAHRLETLKHWSHFNKVEPIFMDVPLAQSAGLSRQVYQVWKKIYLQKEDPSLHMGEIEKLIQLCKYNDEIPEFLLYTIPHLEIETTALNLTTSADPSNHSIENEKNRERQDVTIHQDLIEEEESENVIMHSFEKIETLDNYDGKKRFIDGEDDLDDHMNALDEVQVSQAQRHDQEVKSVFKSDAIFNQNQMMQAPSQDDKGFIQKKIFYYPEWDYRKKAYISNFCKVYESSFATSSSAENRIREFYIKYQKDIIRWERKIQNIFNSPLWLKRQKDGTDLDIDATIRLVSQLRAGFSEADRVYQQKRKLTQDLSLVLLLDSSISTDSYVKGVRVFDVIADSMSLVSELFKQSSVSIQIATTHSRTHDRIEYEIIKNFSDPWSDFKNKIYGYTPDGYTRLGPSIRHANSILQERSSAQKILLLITDGKPTDLDIYEGQYGISDVSKALSEGEKLGVQNWGMTIDHKNQSHFKSMLKKYSIVPSPDLFAEELIKILLRLMSN